MTTLDPNDGYVVLINTFTVDPAKAEALLKVLSDATDKEMRKLPGFVSANLHMSPDKKHVANYAQWRSQADIDAMMKNPDVQGHMRKAAEMAESFEPLYYALREAHSA